jgi:hypothetical protein
LIAADTAGRDQEERSSGGGHGGAGRADAAGLGDPPAGDRHGEEHGGRASTAVAACASATTEVRIANSVQLAHGKTAAAAASTSAWTTLRTASDQRGMGPTR